MKKPVITANEITLLRIAGTVALLFLRPLSAWFFVIYALTGITDAADGWLARRTGTASPLGARLDSVADLVFYGVMLIKLLPVLIKELPVRIFVFAGAVIILRLGAYVAAAVKYHRFAAVHTYMNKLTGAAVFLIPFALLTPYRIPYCICVCVIGAAASAEELIIHLNRASYDPNARSIFKGVGK